MKSNVKKRMVALLAGASALALGGALLCINQAPVAHAAEDGTLVAFYNVGASNEAKAVDAALGLEEKGVTVSTAGTVTAGDTLFTSYATNPTYRLDLSGADSYRVAVIVKKGATGVTVGGQSATISGEGDYQIATLDNVSGGSAVEVAVTGDACAIAADDEAGAATLFAVDYTEGQVIPYGALLANVLENATGYYTDGIDEAEIEYGDITAATGVNVNFTTVDVTGTIKGTKLTVSRYLITMPDDLVYFINGGSHDYDNGRWEKSSDPYYEYNQTIFDYYKNGSGELKNDGTPDREAPNANDWGWYGNTKTAVTHTASAVSFPYSSVRCMDRDNNATLGYYLTGLTSGTQYRVWIGTLSPWHGRTVSITFNGKVVGADNLRIDSKKGYTIFEGVTPDSNGKIDINMKGGSTNEPCFAFIAVQEMETVVDAKPPKLEGETTIGMAVESLTISNVVEGAKLQIHNASKPYQILLEEEVDPSKLSKGEYELNWGVKASELGVAKFNIVQLTNGGVSDDLTVTITDIELVGDAKNMYTLSIPEDEYTTGSIVVTVKAKAGSGIAMWSWRKGEFGNPTVFELDSPYQFEGKFTVSENGVYYVVVTSGLGVVREDIIDIKTIDPNRPEIVIAPTTEGWGVDGKYTFSLKVTSISPVVEYKLLKDGAVQGEVLDYAPTTVTVEEAGEYVIYVKTASGMTKTSTFQVATEENKSATIATVTGKAANRAVVFTFTGANGYELDEYAVVMYRQTDVGDPEKEYTLSGNRVSVNKAGTYVAIVTAKTGETQVFTLTVKAEDLKTTSIVLDNGSGSSAQLGIGIGVMVGGLALAAAAVVVTVILLKKKRAAAAEAEDDEDEHNDEE